MADDQVLLNDEQLMQELLSFGETVLKVTDKNRQILEKKLNHLRARRRMSEKLSQSLIAPKSPVKGVKGRGKRTSKLAVGNSPSSATSNNNLKFKSVFQSGGVDESKCASLLEADNMPPQKKVKKSGRYNEVNDTSAVDIAITAATKPVGLQLAGSKTETLKRGRSAAPAVHIGTGNKNVSDVASKTTSEETLQKPENVSVVGRKGRASGRNKASQVAVSRHVEKNEETVKGQVSSIPDEAVEPMDLTYHHDECEVDTQELPAKSNAQVARRRTYSCDKPESEVSKFDKDSKTASRIPKRSQGKVITHDVGTSTSKLVSSPNVQVPSFSVSTQVVDTALGCAVNNVSVTLEFLSASKSWKVVAEGTTDDRGHCDQLGHGHALAIGTYRLHVDTQSYFQRAGQRCFYPYIDVVFAVVDSSAPVNLQVALCPFGFSTYRTA